MSTLQLTIVTQEQQLLESEVDSLTVPGSEGEMTILPKHISLFSRLQPGELIYRNGQEEHLLVVSKGFIDVNMDNSVTIMVDGAVSARDISLEKAHQAVKEAQETMTHTEDQYELIMAEASLRRALLEIKVAQRSKKNKL